MYERGKVCGGKESEIRDPVNSVCITWNELKRQLKGRRENVQIETGDSLKCFTKVQQSFLLRERK